jgi:hypothetical protein
LADHNLLSKVTGPLAADGSDLYQIEMGHFIFVLLLKAQRI